MTGTHSVAPGAHILIILRSYPMLKQSLWVYVLLGPD